MGTARAVAEDDDITPRSVRVEEAGEVGKKGLRLGKTNQNTNTTEA